MKTNKVDNTSFQMAYFPKKSLKRLGITANKEINRALSMELLMQPDNKNSPQFNIILKSNNLYCRLMRGVKLQIQIIDKNDNKIKQIINRMFGERHVIEKENTTQSYLMKKIIREEEALIKKRKTPTVILKETQKMAKELNSKEKK